MGCAASSLSPPLLRSSLCVRHFAPFCSLFSPPSSLLSLYPSPSNPHPSHESPPCSIRVASPKLVMEEAPESYKNVIDVVNTCHDAGITKKAIKLRPIAVIKG